MNGYIAALKKYAVFDGRAGLAEYWNFFLLNILIIIVLSLIDRMTGGYSSRVGIGLLAGLYTLAVVIPSMAVSVRRLHDTDRSGWRFIILLIPLVGCILFLFFAVQESNAGINQYGAIPAGKI